VAAECNRIHGSGESWRAAEEAEEAMEAEVAEEAESGAKKRREAESRRRRLAAVRLAEKAAEEEHTGVNRKWLKVTAMSASDCGGV
jgi:hypothetical protein